MLNHCFDRVQCQEIIESGSTRSLIEAEHGAMILLVSFVCVELCFFILNELPASVVVISIEALQTFHGNFLGHSFYPSPAELFVDFPYIFLGIDASIDVNIDCSSRGEEGDDSLDHCQGFDFCRVV